MISYNEAIAITNEKNLVQAVCLSTDAKPTTGIANGSTLIEMDTSKTYMFNEEDGEWVEVSQGGGGGGGGGSSDDISTATVIVVNNISYRYVADVFNIVSIEGYEGLTPMAEIPSKDTTTINAVMYKNYCEFSISEFTENITTTGSASYEGDGFVIITGDCTITLNN